MRYASLFGLVILCGCAGGPPHDYYNPAVVGGTRFHKPITVEFVDDVQSTKDKCIAEGYTLIGTSDYAGDQPKKVELLAQARRVHANHVVYSVHSTPAPAGSWHFRFGGGFGGGGSGNDYNQVHILFMGK